MLDFISPALGLGHFIAFLLLSMGSNSEPELVPSIPNNVNRGVTSTYNIWEHALRQQKNAQGQAVLRNNVDIRTLLSPNSMLMVNLVPMDAPHPLYSDDYKDLRTEFLLDYMIQESVSPEDPRMTQPEGLSVNNLNGKSITFKKNPQGKITVEGIDVVKTEMLSDGVNVYTLSNLLFSHQERVNNAFKQLSSQSSSIFGPFGEPIGLPPHP